MTIGNRPRRWDEVGASKWNDWKWQLRNAIRDLDELNETLSAFTELRVPKSRVTSQIASDLFQFKVTPAMVNALKSGLENRIIGAWGAFCASFVPTEFEVARESPASQVKIDCIGEDLRQSTPVAGVTRFYRNRVLLKLTHMCPAYCRYCFRRRLVGDSAGSWNQGEVATAISYIRSNGSIQEVILSGGDPLVLGDDRIRYVLTELRQIDHIRRVRIDTKALTMIPQRVTTQFVEMLQLANLNAVVAHFTHPYELTGDVEAAIAQLIDHGVPVYAHIPLLHEVNDDEITLSHLVERLVDLKVRPYYLIQFIPTRWTEHFRVSIGRGVELIEYLQKNCTGMSVPTYIVYLPSGHGKVPIAPSHLVRRSSDGYVFRAHDGSEVLYREPLINGEQNGYRGAIRH